MMQQQAIRRQIADIGHIEAHLATVAHGTDAVLLSLVEQHLVQVRERLLDRMRQAAVLDPADPFEVEIDEPVDFDQEMEVVVAVVVAMPKTRTSVLSKKDACTMLADTCAICCDNHPRVDSTTTSCGHHYGKACLEGWCRTQMGQHTAPTCPMCKAAIGHMTVYRTRAKTLARS